MLHNRKNPSLVSRAYLYSAIAKLEGAELFYFSPGEVNLKIKPLMDYITIRENGLTNGFLFPM